MRRVRVRDLGSLVADSWCPCVGGQAHASDFMDERKGINTPSYRHGRPLVIIPFTVSSIG